MDVDGSSLFAYSRQGVFLEEFTRAAQRFRQEWRAGPFRAQWRFAADDDPVSRDDLMRWFKTGFMQEVRHMFRGSEVWRGYVGYMQMTIDGLTATKDLTMLRNAAKCSYDYTAGDGTGATAWTNWYVNEASMEEYGRFEIALAHNGKAGPIVDEGIPGLRRDPITNVPITEPEDKAEVYVKDFASPYSRAIGIGSQDADVLLIKAVGASVLANHCLLSDGPFAYEIDLLPWNLDELEDAVALRPVADTSDYADVEYGDEITVSDEIHRIVDVVNYQNVQLGRPPLLYAMGIETNERLTAAGVARPTGAMDRLNDLALLRDLNDESFRLRIEVDGGVVYEKLNETPRYFLYPAPRGLVTVDNEPPTWEARPEPIKIVDSVFGTHLPETRMADKSLIVNESVMMREGANMAEFGPDGRTRAKLDAAIEADKRLAKRVKKRR